MESGDPALDRVALVLATYYVAVTMAKLHGPLGWCERLRHAVWTRRGFVLVDGAWLRGTERAWKMTGSHKGCNVPCASACTWVLLLAYALASMGGIGAGIVDILAAAGGASVLFSLGRYW
jgi:hypothetical protein